MAQYFPPVRGVFASRASVPANLLLWFHHVRWDDRLRSGRTLWEELVRHYTSGVDTVRSMERTWKSLRGSIDPQRFAAVDSFLVIQEHEARWWRDAALSYFETFSRRPIPPGYEAPLHPLSFYESLRCPANRDKPRCPEIYP